MHLEIFPQCSLFRKPDEAYQAKQFLQPSFSSYSRTLPLPHRGGHVSIHSSFQNTLLELLKLHDTNVLFSFGDHARCKSTTSWVICAHFLRNYSYSNYWWSISEQSYLTTVKWSFKCLAIWVVKGLFFLFSTYLCCRWWKSLVRCVMCN